MRRIKLENLLTNTQRTDNQVNKQSLNSKAEATLILCGLWIVGEWANCYFFVYLDFFLFAYITYLNAHLEKKYCKVIAY